MCTFILLLLSGERDFAVTLNKPVPSATRYPLGIARPSTPYNHADLLALSTHLILSGHPSAHQQIPILERLLIVLANVSPFVRSLHMASALNLVQLFVQLSAPPVLLGNEHVCKLVQLLLETFNNIIQYQFEGEDIVILFIFILNVILRKLMPNVCHLTPPKPLFKITTSKNSTYSPSC